jgi:hypothetical protein
MRMCGKFDANMHFRHYSPQIQGYYRKNGMPVGHSSDAEHDAEPF